MKGKQQRDPLFLALTKRVTIFGNLLPYVPFGLIVGAGVAAIVITGKGLESVVFTVFTLGILAAMQARDQDMTAILYMRLKLAIRGMTINRFRRWGCQHYSP